MSNHESEASLLAALEQAAGRKWNEADIRRNAERFSPQAYVDGLDKSMRACLRRD